MNNVLVALGWFGFAMVCMVLSIWVAPGRSFGKGKQHKMRRLLRWWHWVMRHDLLTRWLLRFRCRGKRQIVEDRPWLEAMLAGASGGGPHTHQYCWRWRWHRWMCLAPIDAYGRPRARYFTPEEGR